MRGRLRLRAVFVPADKGHRGSRYFIPRRKPLGGLSAEREHGYSTRVSANRAPIERAIENLET